MNRHPCPAAARVPPMTNLAGGSTVPAVHSLRAHQAAGTPSPSRPDPAAARHVLAATLPCDPPSDGPSPPAPGSQSRTCAIVRLTRKSPIHDPATHGGLVPRIVPLERLPGRPAAQRSRARFERITGMNPVELELRALGPTTTRCSRSASTAPSHWSM